MPTVSSDGKTYTLTLRKGLKYSDGTPVKATDFPADELRSRDFSTMIDTSPGVGFFGNNRRRRCLQQSTRSRGHISGITAIRHDGQDHGFKSETRRMGDLQLQPVRTEFRPPSEPKKRPLTRDTTTKPACRRRART
jgi:hypothetical protein